MSENLEVRGDVAQLIGGNVNEAPRQSNVVNFHMTGEKAVELMLTDLQRKRISALVKELCAITQEKPLDVYRVILTDFGAERMKDMPRVKYHDVVAQVERWIAENKHDVRKGEEAAPPASANEVAKPLLVVASAVPRCDTCSEKDISYARLQRISRGQWMLSAVLAIGCGLLLYKMPMPASAGPNGESHCYFEGKPYSVGSTIKNTGGTLKECAIGIDSVVTSWVKPK
jgi:hypothetical protein